MSVIEVVPEGWEVVRIGDIIKIKMSELFFKEIKENFYIFNDFMFKKNLKEKQFFFNKKPSKA